MLIFAQQLARIKKKKNQATAFPFLINHFFDLKQKKKKKLGLFQTIFIKTQIFIILAALQLKIYKVCNAEVRAAYSPLTLRLWPFFFF